MNRREPNLSIAGRLLLFEIVVGVGLVLAFDQFGLPDKLVFIGIWLFNIITATYLFKAARAQGRAAAFYGLFSVLGPPFSLFSFSRLLSSEALAKFG